MKLIITIKNYSQFIKVVAKMDDESIVHPSFGSWNYVNYAGYNPYVTIAICITNNNAVVYRADKVSEIKKYKDYPTIPALTYLKIITKN